MTISLSNQQSSSGKRVIGIKPFVQEKEPEPPVEEESPQEAINAEKLEQEAQEKVRQADTKIEEAKQQSEQLLQQVQEDIQHQKDQWEQEKQQLIEETTNQAYKEGHEQGKNDAFREYETLVEEAKGIVVTASEDYQDKIESSEETILQLGIKVAEKILDRKLKEDPSAFMSIVHAVIQEVKEQEQVALYVHPEQYSTVIEQKNELEMIVDHHAELSVYPKKDLQPFQCYVESSFGRVDASIDSQLEELRAKLFDLLREA